MALEHYITRGQKKLRCGYTTGSCAALAAGAATHMLLGQKQLTTCSIATPKGIPVEVELLETCFDTASARCAVRKDGGDDIDATDGMLIFATVTKTGTGIHIDGGEGIGRITRKGLEQPVGSAAINRVPRQMIYEKVAAECASFGYTGGLSVVISAPEGEKIALKTFNPNLGIEGGISILGTSGIVEPQSSEALIATIEAELDMLAAEGRRHIVVTPGNYGEDFAAKILPIGSLPVVKCSNFFGETLDRAALGGFEHLYFVGHIGKLVKLAAGVMNTHSRYADGRAEVFCAHAAVAGADQNTCRRLMEAITTDECVDILQETGLLRPVMIAILEKISYHLNRRTGDKTACDVLIFSNRHGVLAATEGFGQDAGPE